MTTGADGTDRSTEELENQIVELASHIHAATCLWLDLVAEYDAREGWASWGCRSCAHWVSFMCGITPVAAREHVRVARRMQELPLIKDAFARGQLSYSKVRALTRLDEVEREVDLLEFARHATAAQLERSVRAYRGAVAVELAATHEGPERWLNWSYDDRGGVVFRGRLPAEEGAVVVAALEAARAAAGGESDDRVSGVDTGDARSASAEAPGPDRDRSRSASAEAPGPDRDGSRSASAEAPATAGDPIGPASAEAPEDASAASSQQLEHALEEAPPAPARLLERTAGEARADALLVMAETMLAGGPAARAGGDRYQVVVHVDTASLQGTRRGEQCELADGAPLAAETARRLACDAALVPLFERDGKPIDVGRKTRAIPPALRRALAARDRGCRFPGCNARLHVDAHHIEHWAHGGATDLANLVQLCSYHHRLLHEGGFSVTPTGAGELIFRRPDGRRIVACPPAPRGRAGAIRERRPGDRPAPVAPDACVSLSTGERLDLDLSVDALLTFAPPTLESPGI